MKHSKDYKKQFSSIILFFSGILLIIPFVFLHAETASDLKNKIDQNNQNISALEAEIAAYQVQLDTLGKQKDSLNVLLKELDRKSTRLNSSHAELSRMPSSA